MPKCIVWWCRNFNFKRKPGVSFFKLTEDRIAPFMQAIGRRDYSELSYCNIICSEHFLPEDIIRTGRQPQLREGAVPVKQRAHGVPPPQQRLKWGPQINKAALVPPVEFVAVSEEHKIKPAEVVKEPITVEVPQLCPIRSVQILTNVGSIDICRICLQPTDDSALTGDLLTEKITFLYSEINLDLYPNPKVCTNCTTQLNRSMELKQKILQSEQFLEEYIKAGSQTSDMLDLIIVPQNLEVNAPSPVETSNESTDFAHITNDNNILLESRCDHNYSINPRFARARRTTRSIETVETILDSQGVPVKALRQKARMWNKTDWGEPPYLCDKCGKTFILLTVYQRHLYSHRAPSPLLNYICEVCGLTMKIAHRYQHSLKHKSKNFQCDKCPKAFINVNSLEKHQLVHSAVKMTQCEVCGVSVRKHYLKIHMKLVHLQGPFKHLCEFCNKKFKVKSYLDHHRKKHLTPKCCCQFCGKIMKYQANLERHIAIFHSEGAIKAKHVCGVCNKTLWNEAKLKYHMKAYHNPEGSYRCEVCNQKFSLERTLKQHCLFKHSDRFLCGFCEQEFRSVMQLRKHMKVEHFGIEFVEELM